MSLLNIYFFTGLPLSGKSYAARLISSKLKCLHISTGDIARELSVTEELKSQTRKNDLFPLEDMLRAELVKRIESSTTTNVVVDGFPRFDDQVKFIKNTQSIWLRMPKIVFVEAGDDITLVTRARARSRDVQDTNETEFMKRLNTAKSNMDGVHRTTRELMIASFTLMSGLDASMIKQFNKGKKNE